MKNSYFIIIAIMLLAIIISLSVLIINQSPSSSPKSAENLETCKTIQHSQEGAINLVFFSDEKSALEYTNFLQEFPPFNLYKKSFNTYVIDKYKPECELYKGLATLCYSKDLIKKSASCPTDYIIVLDNKPRKIRSSSYLNVMSVNINHPKTVLAHEFGHSFVNLAEEYTPAKVPSGSKNCQKECNSFDVSDGCFKGCSEAEFHRSIDNGIMRTLSSNNFGVYNEKLIEERISSSLSPITGRQVSDFQNCKSEKYYLVEGNYHMGTNTISIFEKSIESGCPGTNGYGNFRYALKNSQGEKITQNSFNPQLLFTEAPGEDDLIDGETFESPGQFILKIPIVRSADNLEIEHDNKITKVNLKDMGARACIL
jgi:hypothetical protein